MKQKQNLLLPMVIILLFCGQISAGIKDKKPSANQVAEEKSKEGVNPTAGSSPHVTAFHGGLVLSRVQLKGLDNLEPYAYPKDKDYAERKTSLAGLLVFHTGTGNDSMPAGMYVWDGSRWQRVSFEAGK